MTITFLKQHLAEKLSGIFLEVPSHVFLESIQPQKTRSSSSQRKNSSSRDHVGGHAGGGGFGLFALPIAKVANYVNSERARDQTFLRNLCAEIQKKFLPDQYITTATAAGVYVNFAVNPQAFLTVLLRQILDENDVDHKIFVLSECFIEGGKDEKNAPSTKQLHRPHADSVVVDYPLPLPGLPFEPENLRLLVVAHFIKKVYQALGYKVEARYTLLAYQRFGSSQDLQENDTLEYLGRLCSKLKNDAQTNTSVDEEAAAVLAQLYGGDVTTVKLWEEIFECWKASWRQIFRRMGVELSLETDELTYATPSVVEDTMERLKATFSDLLVWQDDGTNTGGQSKKACVVDLTEHKLGQATLLRHDNIPTTLCIQLSTLLQRNQTSPCKTLYVAESRDRYYRQRSRLILERVWDAHKAEKSETDPSFRNLDDVFCEKVHGLRQPNDFAYSPVQVLDEAKNHMQKIWLQSDKDFEFEGDGDEGVVEELSSMEEYADAVGMSSIVCQMHQAKRLNDMTFDWDRVTGLQKDLGTYLCYTHARLTGIERNASVPVNKEADLSPLIDTREAFDLAVELSRFPKVVNNALKLHEPSVLLAHMSELARCASSSSYFLRVKGQPKPVAEARLLLLHATRKVLAFGMKILGLYPVDRPIQGFYYSDPGLFTSDAVFDEQLQRQPYSYALSSYNVDSSGLSRTAYKHGDPVQVTFQAINAKGILSVPSASDTTNLCNDMAPARFLVNKKSTCTRAIKDPASMCAAGTVLDVAYYTRGFNILQSPAATKSIWSLVNETLCFDASESSKSPCFDAANLPTPIWNATSNVCDRMIAEVKYTFMVDTYASRSLISNVYIDVTFRRSTPLAASTAILQTFSVEFIQIGANPVPKSGNPGYLLGSPLLAGTLASKAINLPTDPQSRITLPKDFVDPSTGTLRCTASTDYLHRIPTSFGEDVSAGCTFYFTMDNLTDNCDEIRKQVYDAQVAGTTATITHVGRFGNASVTNVMEWIKVLNSPPASVTGSETFSPLIFNRRYL
ncbi:Arginyl-tRNA synthetase [Quaeritorhiza haematococci]|nr:Arginyl-tRNA synthetase [Quaeritorhiza haematococci]